MTTQPDILVFPNALPVVIAYLDEHLPDEVTVSASLPSDTTIHDELPWVLVVPSGGFRLVRQQLDRADFRIELFHHAEMLSEIDNLGLLVRAVIESMKGQRFDDCAITRTDELSGISRLPDGDPLITRVGISVSLLVRPLR